ncbi:MAG: cytochrome c [Chloroflexota bacterium]
MNDVRKIIYGTIALFFAVLVLWLSLIYISACGLTLSCRQAAPKLYGTPIPTLIPAKLSAPTQYAPPTATPMVGLPALTPETEVNPNANPDIARPSNPGGPGPAIDLTGNADNGKQLFATNCQLCHGEEGKGGYPNPGSLDGTIPPLNPIDSTLVDPDLKTYATNLDLFIEHGSSPEASPAGAAPARFMPAWGDRGALTPQEIADVLAYIIGLNK